jgi:hypothetical protein
MATVGRRQVAEYGPDTCNWDSDSDTEQHGDVTLNGYVGIMTDANGNPIGSSHKISNAQAEVLRRAFQSSQEESRKATPMNSDIEDQEEMTEDQKGQQRRSTKKARQATHHQEDQE